MKSILILFFIFLPLNQTYGSNGYPDQKAEIVFEKIAIIKNQFCFPVVVSVLNQVFDVAGKSQQELNSPSWGTWNWLPGKRSEIVSKKVFYPLKNKTTVDFGPGAIPTHRNENVNGYDFKTPEKTPVMAMEAGIVIRTISHFTLAHQDEKRMNETNTVEVLHADGTVARYSHLYSHSLKVKLCQKVSRGEELALSGNTGFSSGPHLHVDVFRPTSGTSFLTLPLIFLVSPP